MLLGGIIVRVVHAADANNDILSLVPMLLVNSPTTQFFQVHRATPS